MGKKINVGVVFGGASREREISFAGGRTVFDNLDKSIFNPIPIFLDSFHHLIELDWQYVYKGSIRDFYPPIEDVGISDFQVYAESVYPSAHEARKAIKKIGRFIEAGSLKNKIDIAFLCLHGAGGEDGQIQGLLDFYNIPYTGSGIGPSAIGINKSLQKSLMLKAGMDVPKSISINKSDWASDKYDAFLELAKEKVGFPFVIRPSSQGSSIGVQILDQADFNHFVLAVNKAFFYQDIKQEYWSRLLPEDKVSFAQDVSDIRSGIGFPLLLDNNIIIHPEVLIQILDEHFIQNKSALLKSLHSESQVIVEEFIEGTEFSCIVIKDEKGDSIALPPTEIVKGNEVFDYRSKYLPGLTRKVTPIQKDNQDIQNIQQACEALFEFFQFDVYARIDGFIQSNGRIYLNDPNTTSGMMPSSFFFHQAAELGFNPSQFLSLIIRQSLQARIENSLLPNQYQDILTTLDQALEDLKKGASEKIKVGVVLGGYSSERHISVESGRNIFEKLSSSETYQPIPIFLTGDKDNFELYSIPISLLLKDNADDIKEKLVGFKTHPIIEKLRVDAQDIMSRYLSEISSFSPRRIPIQDLKEKIDIAFIALHGRPGEDGTLQQHLLKDNIPFNGSNPDSSALTIHKYKTLQTLKKHGFEVADQLLISKEEYVENKESVLEKIEYEIPYPLVAKPVDDGCSSAVMMIKERHILSKYLQAIFRNDELEPSLRSALSLSHNEEFPAKNEVLIESRISKGDADLFMEITGGLLTKVVDGVIEYEMFEPSEALAGEAILSLEEKFLAGEGQNITPARFYPDYDRISKKVKSDLEKAAKILGVIGYARIDAFVKIKGEDVETIIIEVNSLPGMTPATCIFHQAAINGYKPYDFIDQIIQFGMKSNTYICT